MDPFVAALIFVAFATVQSVVFVTLFCRHATAATAQVRQDYVDVLLTQKASFEAALQHAHDTQAVGGTPLALAIAQHEAQREFQLQNADQQYQLAKLDIEGRRAPVQRPRAVPSVGAMGD